MLITATHERSDLINIANDQQMPARMQNADPASIYDQDGRPAQIFQQFAPVHVSVNEGR